MGQFLVDDEDGKMLKLVKYFSALRKNWQYK